MEKVERPEKPNITVMKCTYSQIDLNYGHFNKLGSKDEARGKDYTHITLSREDWAQIQHYTKGLREYADYIEDRIEAVKKDTKNQRQVTVNKANEAIGEWEAYANQMKAEKEEAEALNTTLKLICKERANADRKIKPKKKKSGYIVIRSEQGTSYQKDGNGNKLSVDVWKTLIESPHDILMSEPQARKLISEWVKTTQKLSFDGNFYTNFKMIKDFGSHLWRFQLETDNEIQFKED